MSPVAGTFAFPGKHPWTGIRGAGSLDVTPEGLRIEGKLPRPWRAAGGFFVLNALWFVAATVQRVLGDPLWLYLLVGIPVASLFVGVVARLFAGSAVWVIPWSALSERQLSGASLSFRIVGARPAGRVRFDAGSADALADIAARIAA